MGNMLRAFELEERELDPDDPWNEFLHEERRAQSCACAHECAREFGIDLAHTLI
jgi:hypothetical protein